MNEIEDIRERKKEDLKNTFGGKNMENKIDVTDMNFEKEVIEMSKNVPVVVDFWAQWCAPCMMLGPWLEKVAKEYKGRFILAKVNVNDGRSAAEKYGVMSIPNVKMFCNGQVTDEFVGVIPEQAIREWVDRNLKQAD